MYFSKISERLFFFGEGEREGLPQIPGPSICSFMSSGPCNSLVYLPSQSNGLYGYSRSDFKLPPPSSWLSFALPKFFSKTAKLKTSCAESILSHPRAYFYTIFVSLNLSRPIWKIRLLSECSYASFNRVHVRGRVLRVIRKKKKKKCLQMSRIRQRGGARVLLHSNGTHQRGNGDADITDGRRPAWRDDRLWLLENNI